MTKGLIIYRINSDLESTKGIFRKMNDQKRAIESFGLTMDMIYLSDRGVMLNNELIRPYWFRNRLLKRIFEFLYFLILAKKIKKSYDLVYVRYSPFCYGMLTLLKSIKRRNSGSRILIELPTYPYKTGYTGLQRWVINVVSLREPHLKKHVYRILHLGEEESIFGIKTIHLKNGIDCNQFAEKMPSCDSSQLRLIAVGKLWHWHGLDRLITGMYNYVQVGGKIKVHLLIVGDGAEGYKLKQLVAALGLEKNVTFETSKYGEDLDKLFDESDIAVGVLAIHRVKLKYSYALKHREYACRAIPFIYAGDDLPFESKQFILKVPFSDSSINLDQLIDFRDRCYKNIDSIQKEMRLFAQKELSWQLQLEFIKKMFDRNEK